MRFSLKILFPLFIFMSIYRLSIAQDRLSPNEKLFDDFVQVVNGLPPQQSLAHIDSVMHAWNSDTLNAKYGIALFFKAYVLSYVVEDFTGALGQYERALAIFKKINAQEPFDQYMYATVLSGIGSAYKTIESDKGIDYLLKSNEIYKQLGENKKVASNYRNLATYFFSTVDVEPILFFHEMGRAYIMRDTNYSKTSLAYSYRGISQVYNDVDKDSSLYYMQKAFVTIESDSLAQDADKMNLAAGMAELALQYHLFDVAQKYTAIAYLFANDLYGEESIISAHIAFQWMQIYGSKGMYDSVEYYSNKGFAIYDKQGDKFIWKINAYNHLSRIEKARGNYEKALELAHKAMFGNATTMAEPQDLTALLPLDSAYYSYEKLGNAIYNKLELFHLMYKQTGTIQYLKDAYATNIYLLEYLFNVHYKNSLSVSHTSPGFSESVNKSINHFLWTINEAQLQGVSDIKVAEGFEYFTRLKAALLREQVKFSASSDKKLAMQNSSLIDSLKKDVERLIFIKKYREISTDSLVALNTHMERNYITMLEVRNRLKTSEKSYEVKDTLFNGNQHVLSQVDENQAVLDYYYNDSLLYCFVAQNTGVSLTEVAIDSSFGDNMKLMLRHLKTASSMLVQSSANLYELLLNPILSQISDKKSLIIIPYSYLFNIPFEVLPVNEDEYLIQRYAISYNYSSQNKKNQELPQISRVLAYAPVFGKKSSINLTTRGLLMGASNGRELEFLDQKRGAIAELPFAQKEVENIKSIFNNQTIVVTGNDATESYFKKHSSGNDIIHIASHGYSSLENPELSGVFFNQQTDFDDGYLFANEIYSVPIDAQLVVLSACQSGKGRVESIEGALALPRIFIAKGVDNILASLWKVDDKKTMILMERFYRNLSLGMTFSKALQNAKIECIQDSILPVDWSGFVLLGE